MVMWTARIVLVWIWVSPLAWSLGPSTSSRLGLPLWSSLAKTLISDHLLEPRDSLSSALRLCAEGRTLFLLVPWVLATPFPASSLDVWIRNILVRSGSLPEDIRVHPKRVSSAIGSPGFPILGVVSVLILAYSLVPRIQWTGNSLFNSTSSISTPLRWSYFAKMSLYQGLVRVSNTPRSPLLSLRGWKFLERFSISTSRFRFLCLLFAWAFRSFWTLSALAVYLFDQVRLLTRFRIQCPVAHGTEYHKL